MGIIQEFRQRRLVQIVISYLAAGWVVLEVTNTLVERGIVPELLYYVALIWYLGGIPAAGLVGWHHGEKGRQRAPRSEVALLSLIFFAVLGMSGFTVLQFRQAPVNLADTGLDPNRVAVLYFQDVTGFGEDQYLADGLTESLIDELGRVEALDVVSRNGVRPFRGTAASPADVAAKLDAGTVISGAVQRRGEQLALDVELRDGESGSVIHRINLVQPGDRLLEVRDSLVTAVGRSLREALGQELTVRARARETNQTAWTLVQRAEKATKDAEALLHEDPHEALGAFERAKQLLGEAERADTAWTEPALMRGHIDYRLSRLYDGDPREAERLAGSAMDEANRVLERERRNGRALELRGTARYWLYLLGVSPDPSRQHAMLDSARADLERAVQENPRLASAHSTLSHLYYGDNVAQAVLAAQKAYEEDAYLDVIDGVLWRLFNGQLDLGVFAQARRWCEEGARRFPDDHNFVYCQLQLMTTPAADPNADAAWEMAELIEKLSPAPLRPYETAQARLTVGGVLARAAAATDDPVERLALADSANRVMDRARSSVDHAVDPQQELLWVEAYMRSLNSQPDRAIQLLRRAVAINPDHAFGQAGEVAWWWRSLQTHPDFRDLLQS